jgi:hypothetical protein
MKSKSCGGFFSDEISLILFWGNTWSDKMSNQKRIGLEGTIKYAGCSKNYHNDPESIEHRAASGKRRKTPAGCSGEGQAV